MHISPNLAPVKFSSLIAGAWFFHGGKLGFTLSDPEEPGIACVLFDKGARKFEFQFSFGDPMVAHITDKAYVHAPVDCAFDVRSAKYVDHAILYLSGRGREDRCSNE
jgi:hypothetical protein